MSKQGPGPGDCVEASAVARASAEARIVANGDVH